jgi:hypothetical protein
MSSESPGVRRKSGPRLGLPMLGALPVAAWELSLGVWLVVKGFRPSPITIGMTATDSAPAYHDVAV